MPRREFIERNALALQPRRLTESRSDACDTATEFAVHAEAVAVR